MTNLYPLGWVVLVVLGYLLFRYRLIRATQGFRIQAAVDGDRMISDLDIPERHRRAISELMARVVSPTAPWLYFLLVSLGVVFAHSRAEVDLMADIPANKRKAVKSVVIRLWTAGAMLSPIAFMMQIFLVLSVMVVKMVVIGTGVSLVRRIPDNIEAAVLKHST